ncbi:partner of Y14 and mago [Fimicolochytrium jonesii]|uniref:partner of Y14 and mago n=1 Tax=Fimicolochytrium jonesii TaxID=1396493 RepID=UPI0022FDE7D0|nr:partner of Y14 and mago [Fimicolochytrium jonesii]KAI8820264.1 partner of Y14 and mago [Fimicolochytrium jonesii]
MSSISGIKASADGDRVIPASRRPDGSVRKERKVREGYVPQEDVNRYTNAKVEATRVPAGYVAGLGVPSSAAAGANPGADSSLSKSARKNAKRRAKKSGGEDGEEKEEPLPPTPANPAAKSAPTPISTSQPTAPAPAADTEKRIKNLRKKLRQIQDLETKVAGGDPADLNAEQKEKLASKKGVQEEIAGLEKQLAKITL